MAFGCIVPTYETRTPDFEHLIQDDRMPAILAEDMQLFPPGVPLWPRRLYRHLKACVTRCKSGDGETKPNGALGLGEAYWVPLSELTLPANESERIPLPWFSCSHHSTSLYTHFPRRVGVIAPTPAA